MREFSDGVVHAPHEDREERVLGAVELPLRVLDLDALRLRRAQALDRRAHLREKGQRGVHHSPGGKSGM